HSVSTVSSLLGNSRCIRSPSIIRVTEPADPTVLPVNGCLIISIQPNVKDFKVILSDMAAHLEVIPVADLFKLVATLRQLIHLLGNEGSLARGLERSRILCTD